AGHEVIVLAGRGENWNHNIKVKIVPLLDSRHPEILEIKKSLDQGYIPTSYENIVHELLQILHQELEDCDKIIAHNIASLHKNLPLTDALYRYALSGAANRLILWHHDFAWNSGHYQGELHPGQPWNLTRIAWPGVTQVVVSETRRQELITLTGISPAEIHVIPAGIDLPIFLSLNPETIQLCRKLNLLVANPLLFTPVRVTKRKNLELAIFITAELMTHMSAAQLVITGPLGAHNPTNQKYLENLLQLRAKLHLEHAVHFIAEHVPEGLSEQQIAEFYRLADVLLLPSREEGFGIPILEAGMGRLSIFCTDIPPLRALGGSWVNYFTLEEPPAKIAQKIFAYLCSDPHYQLRAHVRQHYTWEAIYRNLIFPLLNEKR
ncbi:MAG: glycosyltransferase family 4 protein, partial [Anaerolineales bacterium]